MDEVEARLEELRALGLHRRMRVVRGAQGPRVTLDGRRVLLLCSNNYLGLAEHPRLREAASEAALRWGAGAGASRLVSGNMTLHDRLEERLAAFEGTEACVLFGSGYLANTGVVSALARAGEVVCSDQLNHASIVDGCRLARAETFVYRHCDVEHLALGPGARGSSPARSSSPTRCSRWTVTWPRSPRSSRSRGGRRPGGGRRGPRDRRAGARWPRRGGGGGTGG